MTNSRDTAARVIALIENAPFPPSTRYIKEMLGISTGQFFNAKPYLTGYKMVALNWFLLDKVAEAELHHQAQRVLLTVGYNKTTYRNRLNRCALGCAA